MLVEHIYRGQFQKHFFSTTYRYLVVIYWKDQLNAETYTVKIWPWLLRTDLHIYKVLWNGPQSPHLIPLNIQQGKFFTSNKCNQMVLLFCQYQAINNNENLSNGITNCQCCQILKRLSTNYVLSIAKMKKCRLFWSHLSFNIN